MSDLVEVAFSSPEKQWVIPVSFVGNRSVGQVISDSGILQEVPDINLSTMGIGIFGQKCKLEKIVAPGDRVEIYRNLLQNPMEARRNRAKKKV